MFKSDSVVKKCCAAGCRAYRRWSTAKRSWSICSRFRHSHEWHNAICCWV